MILKKTLSFIAATLKKILNANPLILTTILFFLTVMLFFPGGLSPDSLAQYKQGLTEHYEDGHPVLMALFWKSLHYFCHGPVPMLMLQFAIYWLALVGIITKLFPKSNIASNLVLILIGLFPPVLGLMGVIWKDCLMLSFILLGISCLLVDKKSSNYKLNTFLASLFFLISSGLRVNLAPALLPLFLYSAWIWFPSTTNRRKTKALIAGIVLTIFAVLLPGKIAKSVNALPTKLWRITASFDIASVSYLSRDYELLRSLTIEPSQENIDLLNQLYTSRHVGPLIFGKCDPTDPKKCLPPFINTNFPNSDEKNMLETWIKLPFTHPGSYFSHRLINFNNILGNTTEEIWAPFYFHIDENEWGYKFIRSDALQALVPTFVELSNHSIVYKVWFYLLLSVFMLAYLFYRSLTGNMLAKAVLISGLLYQFTFFFLAMSADFRYSIWLISSVIIAILLSFRHTENT